jgi:phosphoribosylglycinamide formyltransferase-1
MRLFTAEFVQRWYGRMLNIHPSLLPSFPGLDPHGQALGRRRQDFRRHRAFRDPETDAGPIVMQGAVVVADDDTAATLGARIPPHRAPHLPEALRLLANGKVRLDGDSCRISGQASPDGTLDLARPD